MKKVLFFPAICAAHAGQRQALSGQYSFISAVFNRIFNSGDWIPFTGNGAG